MDFSNKKYIKYKTKYIELKGGMYRDMDINYGNNINKINKIIFKEEAEKAKAERLAEKERLDREEKANAERLAEKERLDREEKANAERLAEKERLDREEKAKKLAFFEKAKKLWEDRVEELWQEEKAKRERERLAKKAGDREELSGGAKKRKGKKLLQSLN